MEMRHQQVVRSLLEKELPPVFRPVAWATLKVTWWKMLSFWLAIMINFLILTCYEYPNGLESMECSSRLMRQEVGVPIDLLIFVLGLLQTLTSTLILLHFMLNYAPLIVMKGWRKQRRKKRLTNQHTSSGSQATQQGGAPSARTAAEASGSSGAKLPRGIGGRAKGAVGRVTKGALSAVHSGGRWVLAAGRGARTPSLPPCERARGV